MSSSALEAREERWAKKIALARDLAADFPGKPSSLAVLTLRMPAFLRTSGRFSSSALSMHASFAALLREKGIGIPREEFRTGGDGPESYFSVSLDPLELKRLAIEWESTHPLGDLADLDVMDASSKPITRADLGFSPRKCLICENEAAVCSAGQRHETAIVEARVNEILLASKKNSASLASSIGRLALTATLYEAAAAPKPGLVDPHSRGAHRDMDYLTFLASAAALGPWFSEFAALGSLHRGEPIDLLPALREAGKAAERDMFAATGGVNTHKGLIFSMGLLCAAAGRLQAAGRFPDSATCVSEAAAIVRGISERDFASVGLRMAAVAAPSAQGVAAASGTAPSAQGAAAAGPTVGERLYLAYGVRGIRGEAEDGFPSVIDHALPRLRADLAAGLSMNDAMIDSLFVLFTIVDDTNVLGRAGREGLSFLREGAANSLRLGGMTNPDGRAAIRAMDSLLIERNISPGGCADLLALTVFLELLATAGSQLNSGGKP